MLPCLDRYAGILVKGEQHVQCLIQEHEVQSQWAEGPQEKDEGGTGTRWSVTGTAGPQGDTPAPRGTCMPCLSLNQRLTRGQDAVCTA